MVFVIEELIDYDFNVETMSKTYIISTKFHLKYCIKFPIIVTNVIEGSGGLSEIL